MAQQGNSIGSPPNCAPSFRSEGENSQQLAWVNVKGTLVLSLLLSSHTPNRILGSV